MLSVKVIGMPVQGILKEEPGKPVSCYILEKKEIIDKYSRYEAVP